MPGRAIWCAPDLVLVDHVHRCYHVVVHWLVRSELSCSVPSSRLPLADWGPEHVATVDVHKGTKALSSRRSDCCLAVLLSNEAVVSMSSRP